MSIKAIQTYYNGYHFRSRLEARYSVCFDTLGLQWDYEPEGYQLGNTWYLPDFFIHDFDCFIEIKGVKPSEEERNKAQYLTTYKPVVIFHGLPGEYPGEVFLFDSTDGSGGEQWWDVWMSFAVFDDGKPDWRLITYNPRKDREYLTPYTYKDVRIETGTSNLFIPIQSHDIGSQAMLAAKQARFEHGEGYAR